METNKELHDLAVDMQVIRDGTVNPAYRESADKAMRIIFELSKVENKPGMDEPWWGACAGAVRRCREIAKDSNEKEESAISNMAIKVDNVDSIVNDFMRFVNKTRPLENVSITVAYATKLSHRIIEAHKREVSELRRRLDVAEGALDKFVKSESTNHEWYKCYAKEALDSIRDNGVKALDGGEK